MLWDALDFNKRYLCGALFYHWIMFTLQSKKRSDWL